jgi:hypothetical protein
MIAAVRQSEIIVETVSQLRNLYDQIVPQVSQLTISSCIEESES